MPPSPFSPAKATNCRIALPCRSFARHRGCCPKLILGYYKRLEAYLWPIDGPLLRSDSVASILNTVLHGNHLSVIASASAKPLGISDQFCTLPISDPLPEATYSLIYPRRAPLTETARLMIDVIRRHCKKFDWLNVAE